MLLSKCALFLLEDSSSSNDSNLEDILSDDYEQVLLMIAAKELEDKKKPNGRGQRSVGFASLGIARSGIACLCKTTSRRYQPIRPISSIVDIECGVRYL
jgi:hypothetical protein